MPASPLYWAGNEPDALPMPLTPLLDETVDSFIARLAAANHLNYRALRACIANNPSPNAPVPLTRLAVMAGIAASRLRYALLELADERQLATMRVRGRPRTQFRQGGCERCQAGHGGLDGPTRPVVWALHEDVVCLKHRRWIRTGGVGGSVDLSAHPEIVAANRAHRLLIRRHGRAAVLAGHRAAQRLMQDWGVQNFYSSGTAFEQRMLRLLGEGWQTHPDDPAYRASFYPEAVALTRLLTAPSWRALLLDDHLSLGDPRVRGLTYEDAVRDGDIVLLRSSPNIEAFVAEARRTVNDHFFWNPEPLMYTRNTRTPLTAWVLGELRARSDSSPAMRRPRRAPTLDVHL